MKEGIHPEYKAIKATCSCGNVINTHSTIGHDIHLDVCGELSLIHISEPTRPY